MPSPPFGSDGPHVSPFTALSLGVQNKLFLMLLRSPRINAYTPAALPRARLA
ncbi:hypothetical protein ACFFLM_20060 [Deinococcus oregonensis]|uniref:Uncharacterized protein n=1 Tax=Deinococcus oregonensis TaxID=1805970 RepID=A0ABV6B3H5_9DEIO